LKWKGGAGGGKKTRANNKKRTTAGQQGWDPYAHANIIRGLASEGSSENEKGGRKGGCTNILEESGGGHFSLLHFKKATQNTGWGGGINGRHPGRPDCRDGRKWQGLFAGLIPRWIVQASSKRVETGKGRGKKKKVWQASLKKKMTAIRESLITG